MTIDSEYEGGVSFRESSVLSPGDRPVVVEIYGHKVGIGICHDKRFEELARLYRNLGNNSEFHFTHYNYWLWSFFF